MGFPNKTSRGIMSEDVVIDLSSLDAAVVVVVGAAAVASAWLGTESSDMVDNEGCCLKETRKGVGGGRRNELMRLLQRAKGVTMEMMARCRGATILIMPMCSILPKMW